MCSNTGLLYTLWTFGSNLTIIYIFVGCNLDAKNILGQSPLMRAVIYDDLEMVKVLKKGGMYLKAIVS